MKQVIPGLLLTATIAMAVSFISANLGGPAMLYALLFGLVFNFLSDHEELIRGIRFAGRSVLRFGVALLGARITVAGIEELGWPLLLLIAIAVVSTIVVGWGIARLLGLGNYHAILTSSSVAICGASAALAVSSIFPKHADHEQNTALTVVGVTVLSTVAMIVYPVVVLHLGVDDATAGFFLGATIHDVAQVVGAGYIVSEPAGDTSTLVKLIRVAFLFPVVVSLSLLLHRRRDPSELKEPILPWFLVGFVALVAINSFGLLNTDVTSVLRSVSSWCLLIGVAAVGIRTSMAALAKVGMAPVVAMVLQSVFLALLVTVGLWLVNTRLV